MTDSPNNSNDKNIAVLAHLGGIFFGFVPALILWFLKKDDNPYIGAQAREALNFQITVLIGYVAACFVLMGFLLLPAIYVANLVFCVIAAVNVSKGADYRYPLSLRLIS
jgi:hypothetical protein